MRKISRALVAGLVATGLLVGGATGSHAIAKVSCSSGHPVTIYSNGTSKTCYSGSGTYMYVTIKNVNYLYGGLNVGNVKYYGPDTGGNVMTRYFNKGSSTPFGPNYVTVLHITIN